LLVTKYFYPGFDYWLYHRSPFCRLSEFTLGALIAALYDARSASPASVSYGHWRCSSAVQYPH
jgi:hypothetical protein